VHESWVSLPESLPPDHPKIPDRSAPRVEHFGLHQPCKDRNSRNERRSLSALNGSSTRATCRTVQVSGSPQPQNGVRSKSRAE